MSHLKLAALDVQDLEIVSAHVQDAVMKVGDLVYRPAEKRFFVEMNRFVWENRPGLFTRTHERRRSVLHFDAVTGVRTSGFSREDADEVLSLLAIRFVAAGDSAAGTIELTCAGAAAIRLDVTYIEARLTDLGAAWETRSRPDHRN